LSFIRKRIASEARYRRIGEHRRYIRSPKDGVVSRCIECVAAIQAMVVQQPKVAKMRHRGTDGEAIFQPTQIGLTVPSRQNIAGQGKLCKLCAKPQHSLQVISPAMGRRIAGHPLPRHRS
jgi:hypothetical protein